MTHEWMIALRRWGACGIGLLVAVLLYLPQPLLAQSADWQERGTTKFTILFPAGSEAKAEQYAQFVDGVYDEVSAVFSYQTPPPVVLRIYPTMELYYQANPLAQQLPGVVAHAHTGRREISIALPQTANQPQEQIVNNVRHELTHIIAADLSGGKLTTAFQEGTAQYLEHPSAELDAKMQLMQQVIAADRLLPWSELNKPGVAYADPRIGYPESYTIVAFLVGRNGFATFRTFIEETKTSSGYRGALEAAYGVSADQLEQEWLAQLNEFVNGGYQSRGVGAFDLSQAEALIGRGEYNQAVQELENGLATIRGSGQTALIQQAEQLLQRAKTGVQAQTQADEARAALERGDYRAARDAATGARDLMNTLGQAAQMQVMDQYIQIADQGLAAQRELQQANGALQTLRVGEARSRLAQAYRAFTRLGDESNAARAQTALLRIRRTETVTAVSFVVLAALTLGWNVHRRVNERGKGLPFG